MRPVAQLIDDPENGDCFRACVASILEVDPRSLPNAGHKDDPDKRDFLCQWNDLLAPHNLCLLVPAQGTHFTEFPFYIWSIRSPKYQGKTHAVVVGYDENREGMSSWYIAWDPSPWRDEPGREPFYKKPLNAYIFAAVEPRLKGD